MIASESPINWAAGIAFGLVFIIVIIRRVAKLGSLERQLGPAFGAGLAGAAVVKASHPLYLFVLYRSIEGVDDLWLYVYGGSLAAFFLGLDLIHKALKTNPSPTQ